MSFAAATRSREKAKVADERDAKSREKEDPGSSGTRAKNAMPPWPASWDSGTPGAAAGASRLLTIRGGEGQTKNDEGH